MDRAAGGSEGGEGGGKWEREGSERGRDKMRGVEGREVEGKGE